MRSAFGACEIPERTIAERSKSQEKAPLSSEMTVQPVQPVLAIAADAAARERISAAIKDAGGEPIHVENASRFADASIPHRFVVFAWDGSDEVLKEVTRRLKPGTQLVAVVPPVDLKRMTRLLADENCDHVVTDSESGMRWLAVTVG